MSYILRVLKARDRQVLSLSRFYAMQSLTGRLVRFLLRLRGIHLTYQQVFTLLRISLPSAKESESTVFPYLKMNSRDISLKFGIDWLQTT